MPRKWTDSLPEFVIRIGWEVSTPALTPRSTRSGVMPRLISCEAEGAGVSEGGLSAVGVGAGVAGGDTSVGVGGAGGGAEAEASATSAVRHTTAEMARMRDLTLL
jgi:hypothetical protein